MITLLATLRCDGDPNHSIVRYTDRDKLDVELAALVKEAKGRRWVYKEKTGEWFCPACERARSKAAASEPATTTAEA